MLKSRLLLVSCLAAAIGLATAASVARANALHTMYLTVSAPFALPGVALPAGTYVFEVVMPGSLDLVRVSSRDRGQVYLTAFTQRVNRPAGQRPDRSLIFNEVPAGMTPPIKAWFPLGESLGHEFIYPADSRQLGATR